MLSVEKLTFAYGDLQVLWGIDLEVKQGEIVTVANDNGGGQVVIGVGSSGGAIVGGTVNTTGNVTATGEEGSRARCTSPRASCP